MTNERLPPVRRTPRDWSRAEAHAFFILFVILFVILKCVTETEAARWRA